MKAALGHPRRMLASTLAHLSDLHIGRSSENDVAAERLCEALVRQRIDHVVVTGDVTHRGRRSEAQRFERIFAPLWNRLTVVPGNHDRAGEDAGARWMDGQRVCVSQTPGLYLVRVDSTGEHNRSIHRSHGDLCTKVLGQVDSALGDAPANSLVVLLLHHHVLPLPEEGFLERVSTLLGWPFASELPLGLELLRLAEGRSDLVLHGHRHVPRAMRLTSESGRSLDILNAGSTTELSRFRLFSHSAGALLGPPRWVRFQDTARSPVALPSSGLLQYRVAG